MRERAHSLFAVIRSFPCGKIGPCRLPTRRKTLLRTQVSLVSIYLVLICFPRLFEGQQQTFLSSGLLPTARATDWTQAGISGGIPSGSWTQCGATIAAYGSSGSPASPAVIVNALNHTGTGYTSCTSNQYVQLAAGTFYLNAAIHVSGVSNQELRGMGASQTHLSFSNATSCVSGALPCLIGFDSSDGTYPTQPPAHIYNWTAGYSQGGNSIVLSSGANIVANSTMIVLDQCDTGYTGAPCTGAAIDNGNYFVCSASYSTTGPTGCAEAGPDTGFARPYRFEWEIVQATACSPACGNSGTTTVTITPAIQQPNWASGQTPQAWLVQPAAFVGVKNLSIDGSAVNFNSAGIGFNNVVDGWVSGVSVLNVYNIGIWALLCDHMEIESNYLYNEGQNLAYADPAGIKYDGSNNLIQNNIIQATRPETEAEGPSNGDVVAYNFAINTYTGNDYLFPTWFQHSAGDNYDLFEGNIGAQMAQDNSHGSHLMGTFFRNLFTGFESCANGPCGSFTAKDSNTNAVQILSNNRYANYIANILGSASVTTTYQSTANYYNSVLNTGYIIGSGNDGGSPAIPADPLVATTLMRWGNWDIVHAATQFNTSEVPSGISVYPNSVPTACVSGGPCTASFYQASSPSWWPTSIPFPAIGPDVSGGNVGQCAGTLNTPGQYAGVAATNASQCAGQGLATAWAGHVNAIPAMACYLSLGGVPDGTGGALSFNAANCYPGSTTGSSGRPATPTNLTGVLIP